MTTGYEIILYFYIDCLAMSIILCSIHEFWYCFTPFKNKIYIFNEMKNVIDDFVLIAFFNH